MPRCKRRRTFEPAQELAESARSSAANPLGKPESAESARTTTQLPGDLLLEIVARTDAVTLFRCTACCKSLRRDILDQAFIRRVCAAAAAAGGIVPPRMLGFLRAYDKERTPRPPAPFVLAHPVTPATASFSSEHLTPFLSRGANADVLGRYEPVTSRNGLVVLKQWDVCRRGRADMICVFEPMTSSRWFFPDPPDVGRSCRSCRYVLLTAVDGNIGCSFLLLAAEIITNVEDGRRIIRVQTVSSDASTDRKWGPVTIARHPWPRWSKFHTGCSNAVVLGGLVHWLMRGGDGHHILTYDVGTTKAGSIELPNGGSESDSLLLTSSPDGRLRLLVAHKFMMISVWLLLTANDSVWVRHTVIDTEAALPALVPEVPPSLLSDAANWVIQFAGSGVRTGAVLLRFFIGRSRAYRCLEEVGEKRPIVLDVETKEMRRVGIECNIALAVPYVVDLPSRLSAMKPFSLF